MEKKVIKFNLVGAIFTLILIIALIVGLIVWIPKIKKQMNNNKETQKLSQEQEDRINSEKDYKEILTLENGKEVQTRMRYFKSDYGYAMKYEADLFYVNKVPENADDYISLYSNSVGLLIDKREGKFDELQQKLTEEGNKEKEQNKEAYDRNTSEMVFNGDRYEEKEKNPNHDIDGEKQRLDKVGQMEIQQIKINNIDAYKRTLISKEDVKITYVLKKDDNTYYNIEMRCSKDFEEDLLPIMEKMVESFEILIK